MNYVSKLTLLLVCFGASVVFAGATIISYQGFIEDSAGDPLDGTLEMTFTLWDSLVAGDSLWAETHPLVQVEEGLFTVLLGSVQPIPASLFKKNTLYLGIRVGADAEMTPRTLLGSSGFSHHSIFSDSAGWADSSGWADTAGVALTVVDDAIEFDDIAQNGAAEGQIIKWDGSQWIAASDSIGSDGWDWSDSSSHGPDSVLYADSSLHSETVTTIDGATGGTITGDVIVDGTIIAGQVVVEPQIRHKSLTPMSFHSITAGGGAGGGGEVELTRNTNIGYFRLRHVSGGTELAAPIELPHGAKLLKVVVFINGPGSMDFSVEREPFTNLQLTMETLGSQLNFTTSNAPGDPTPDTMMVTSFTDAIIDNTSYVYWMILETGTWGWLNGARIDYEITSTLP